MTSFVDIFEAELAARGLDWCFGDERCGTKSHKRGFVLDADKKTVHLDSEIATRSSLHRGLHEIAHCVLSEKGLRRFEKEAQANKWAERRMRELHIPVPSKVAAKGRSYARRMKSWGDSIRKGVQR